VTSSLDRPLVSVAGAAAILECPVWLVDVLVSRKLLCATRVQGTPRIRHRELHAFIRANAPSTARVYLEVSA
jgi:hypothetical protein